YMHKICILNIWRLSSSHRRQLQICASIERTLYMRSRLCVIPRPLTIEDPDALDEIRFITLAIDALGRVLVLIYAPRGQRTRIISAHKASPNETRQYHAWRIRFQ